MQQCHLHSVWYCGPVFRCLHHDFFPREPRFKRYPESSKFHYMYYIRSRNGLPHIRPLFFCERRASQAPRPRYAATSITHLFFCPPAGTPAATDSFRQKSCVIAATTRTANNASPYHYMSGSNCTSVTCRTVWFNELSVGFSLNDSHPHDIFSLGFFKSRSSKHVADIRFRIEVLLSGKKYMCKILYCVFTSRNIYSGGVL